MRRRYVYDEFHDKMVEVTENYVAPSRQPSGPLVMPDIAPYKSMITGEMINSRSRHREHLKAHDCIEVGNETAYMVKNRIKPEPPPGLKEAMLRAAYKHGILKP